MSGWKKFSLYLILGVCLFIFSIVVGMAVVFLGIDPYHQNTIIAVGAIFFLLIYAFTYSVTRPRK